MQVFRRSAITTSERGDRVCRIGGKPSCAFDVPATIDILVERARQRLEALGQGPIVGGRSTVKGFSERLHALRNAQIADAHLAQVGVHVAAEMIEQSLPKSLFGARPQLPKDHPQMQQNHIEAAIHRVRHPVRLIKRGLSRLRHDRAIDRFNGAARRSGGLFFEAIERPAHVGTESQPAGGPLLQSGTVAGYVNRARDARA